MKTNCYSNISGTHHNYNPQDTKEKVVYKVNRLNGGSTGRMEEVRQDVNLKMKNLQCCIFQPQKTAEKNAHDVSGVNK